MAFIFYFGTRFEIWSRRRCRSLLISFSAEKPSIDKEDLRTIEWLKAKARRLSRLRYIRHTLFLAIPAPFVYLAALFS